MKSSAFYTVLGIGIVIVIGIIWWGMHREHLTTPQPVPTENHTAASSTPSLSGMSIYTTGQYGFSIFYPSALHTQTSFDTQYLLPITWRMNPTTTTGTPILEIIGYKTQSSDSYPRYFETEVRIGRSNNPKEIAACLKTGNGEMAKAPTIINGTNWNTFSFGDAAMMQYVNGMSYRTMHDSYCYALEEVETGADYRDASSSNDIAQSTLDQHYSDLQKIVDSFTFATK